MQFDVRAIARNRQTGRRVGRERTERIDTETNTIFAGMTACEAIRVRYETFWNDLNPQSRETVQVLGVEPVRADSVIQRITL